MAEVVLERVTKVYPGGVLAVDSVSLAITDREFVVLVGPSGCGKSTTLRMVAGLEDITDGTIRIGDRVVNEVQPKDRDIAMVFQNYALYPHMSVYKNMAFGLMLRRKLGRWDNPLARVLAPSKFRRAREERTAIDQRVRRTASLLGIETLLDRRPKALSGGQRQRVAVGRAMVREPKAFLFDEPLSNLDAKLRVEMRAEIKRLHRRVETTTIYVTHDQEEAMTLGDRIVVMKDGIIHQCASPLEVYDRPVNRFVAGFIGTPAMNFLEGRMVAHEGRLCFDSGDDCLAVTEAHREALGCYLDQPILMGIRPESIRLGTNGDHGAQLSAKVNLLEPLGDRVDVHVSTARNLHLVCRVESGRRIREGESLQLVCNMERAHFFEPVDGGRNVTLSSP